MDTMDTMDTVDKFLMRNDYLWLIMPIDVIPQTKGVVRHGINYQGGYEVHLLMDYSTG